MTDPFSYCAYPLRLVCNTHVFANATCFFYSKNSKNYLVTNWHVLSGREPEDGQPKNSDGAIPDSIEFLMYRNGQSHRPEFVRAPLAVNGVTIWLQHPEHGRNVDIAVLPFGTNTPFSPPDGLIVTPMNLLAQTPDIMVNVGIDIFILGFPFSTDRIGLRPVWKRASIATEPDTLLEGLPKILVDTASRPGMSGSPVIIRSFGSYTRANGGMVTGSQHYTRFIGVYSGRIRGDKDDAQLGIVWSAALIDEIIAGSCPGDNVLPDR